MFLNIIQLMLLGLLIYIVWNVLVDRKDASKVKPRAYLAWVGAFIILLFILTAFVSPFNGTVVDFGALFTFPLKPLGLPIFLLFLALGGIEKGTIKKEAERYIWSAFLLLVFFSQPLVASWLAQQGELEALNAAQIAAQRNEPVGAIVLLGQSATQLNLLEPKQLQLTDTSARVLQAAEEYLRQQAIGSSPVVVVSAGPRPGFNTATPSDVNLVEARDVARLLVRLGVPQQAIVLEPTGVDFRTSALAVQSLVKDGVIPSKVILVTPALGMQRARQAFALLGIETLPSPAGFLSFQQGAVPKILVDVFPDPACKGFVNLAFRDLRQLRLADFISNADSLFISNRVVNEFWTSVYYLLRGWLASGVEPIPQVRDLPCNPRPAN
jgi:uncharacterized SAM-binding protein YcdF (DUF218 family)